MLIIDMIISVCLSPISFLLISRKNVDWGIPDIMLIIGEESVAGVFSQCLTMLPMSVLIAKLCPKRIEATSYALMAGIANLRLILRKLIGTAINDKFVGVSKDDLSNYWVLVAIQTVCSLLPLIFLWLIPTRKEVNALATKIRD